MDSVGRNVADWCYSSRSQGSSGQRRASSSLLVGWRTFKDGVCLLRSVIARHRLVVSTVQIGWNRHEWIERLLQTDVWDCSIQAGVLIGDVRRLRNHTTSVLRWCEWFEGQCALAVIIEMRRDERWSRRVFHVSRHGAMPVCDLREWDAGSIENWIDRLLAGLLDLGRHWRHGHV